MFAILCLVTYLFFERFVIDRLVTIHSWVLSFNIYPQTIYLNQLSEQKRVFLEVDHVN
jgi:TM2 domain-containing membrane protein YozV